MKRMFVWMAGVAAAAGASVYGYRALQAGRRRLDRGLENAERVTASARETLRQTETAVREAREVTSPS